MEKTKIFNVPSGTEISGCIKFYFNNFEISLTTLGSFPTIKIYLDETDVTKDVAGLENIYGNLENLIAIYSILEKRKSLF